MPLTTMTAAELAVGDRIPGPNTSVPGPAVTALTEPGPHPDLDGTVVAVTVDGEDTPRLIHHDSLILVDRPDGTEETP